MRNIEKIIRPYCYKIIPLIYDDSLSYYEVLCKLRAKLNEVIDTLNIITGTDIKEEVLEEVNEILNEWLQDGTLEEIINNALYQETDIQPEYISTFNFKNGDYDGSTTWDAIQSICLISDSVGVAVCNSRNGNDNTSKIFKFDIQSGMMIGSPVNIQAGHANDICFDGEFIYIAWLKEYDKTPINRITKCDVNFNLAGYITPPVIPNINAITYDDIAGVFYGYNGDKIYTFNKDFTECLSEVALKNSYYRSFYQQETRFETQTIENMIDGILINYAFPSISIKYDKDTGDIKRIHNYKKFYANGFNTLELESVVYNKYDKYYYMMSYAVQGRGDFSNNTYGRFSLEKGQIEDIIINATTRPNTHFTAQSIFVDNTISSNAKMLGTETYPFKYLQQAVDCLSVIGRDLTIIVKGADVANNMGTVSITGKSNMRITSESGHTNENNPNMFIPYLQLTNCSNILIFYMSCEQITLLNSVGVQLGSVKANHCNFNRATMLNLATNNALNDVTLVNASVQGRTLPGNSISITSATQSYDLGTLIS